MPKLQVKKRKGSVYIYNCRAHRLHSICKLTLWDTTHKQRKEEEKPAHAREQGHTASMSGGAEIIAGAVVQRLAGMLGDKAWERVELLWIFEEDVEGLESKMIDLKVALRYADRRSRESADDEVVQHWLKRYKSVAYDIKDTLDELVANATIWGNSKCTVRQNPGNESSNECTKFICTYGCKKFT